MTKKYSELEASDGRAASECSDVLCAAPFFDMTKLKTSPYPSDFIPKGGKPFFFVADPGAPGGDCYVKGFHKDGEIHVQEIKCT